MVCHFVYYIFISIDKYTYTVKVDKYFFNAHKRHVVVSHRNQQDRINHRKKINKEIQFRYNTILRKKKRTIYSSLLKNTKTDVAFVKKKNAKN